MTVTIIDLWLPILVAAIAVFFASFIVWMVLNYHQPDIKKLPNEDEVKAMQTAAGIAPGQYMWPNCESKAEMNSDEFKERFNAGPWGVMIIPSTKPNLGRNLILMFSFYLVVGVFVAYITTQARVAGADFLSVFQIAGATAFAAYALGNFPHSVFFFRPRRALLTELIDATVYTLITAGIFAAMWPAAPTPALP